MRSADSKYRHPYSGQSPKYVQRALDADPPDRRKVVEDLKSRFDGINRRAIQCGTAWLTSIPGETVVTVEALPTSTFPDELRDKGYQLRPEGEGERILAHAIVERFARGADGALVPITVGSTLAIVHRVMHAGIVKTRQWSFAID